jgi:hypothetical protein
LNQNFLTTEKARRPDDEELLNKLLVNPLGVTSSEAEKRLQQFGLKERVCDEK